MKSSLPIAASGMLGFFLSGCALFDNGDNGSNGGGADCESGLGKKAALLHDMQKGWKVDSQAGIMLSTTTHLFDLCKEHVSIDPLTSADISISDASSVEEMSKEIAVSVGAEGSFGAFSASVSASSAFASSSKYEMHRVDRNIIAQMYKVSLNTAKLYELLSKENREYLTTGKPEDIVDRFGEFFATEAGFGGILRSIAMIEKEENQESSDIQAEAEASFAVGGVKVGAKDKAASNNSKAQAHYDVKVFGGDPKPWLAVSQASDIPKAQAEWAASFDESKLYAMSLKVKPIWEVLEGQDDAQAKKIKDYLTAKWASNNMTDSFGQKGQYVPVAKAMTKEYTPSVDGCVAHRKWTDYALHGSKGNNADDIQKNADCFCKEQHEAEAALGSVQVVAGSIQTSSPNRDRTIACGEDSDEGCFWSCKCITHLTCSWMPKESSESLVLV